MANELRARAQPQGAPLDDLREVVGEAQQRARERDAEHADRPRRERRQQQERHRDRGEDDDPAHRRRAGLGVVLLRPLLADVLAELARAQERDELRRQEDAYEQGRGPRDQHLAHQPAACSASVTISSPTPRDPLTSTTSPAPTSSGSSAAASPASSSACDSPSNSLEHRGGARAHRHQQLDPGGRRVGADLAVVLVLGGAELEHVAQDRHAAALGMLRGEIVKGGAHGERVGVVAVVDDEGPDPERHALARAWRRSGRRPPRSDAPRSPARRRRRRAR